MVCILYGGPITRSVIGKMVMAHWAWLLEVTGALEELTVFGNCMSLVMGRPKLKPLLVAN